MSEVEADPRIIQAIDNTVAASRWQIAARFEVGERADTYRRLAERRRAAVTVLLSGIGEATGGVKYAGRPITREALGGGNSPTRIGKG